MLEEKVGRIDAVLRAQDRTRVFKITAQHRHHTATYILVLLEMKINDDLYLIFLSYTR